LILATITSYGERPHEDGSLWSCCNLLCGGFGRLLLVVCKQHERLLLLRGDVEPVSDAVRNAHFHDIANLPHAAAPCWLRGALRYAWASERWQASTARLYHANNRTTPRAATPRRARAPHSRFRERALPCCPFAARSRAPR